MEENKMAIGPLEECPDVHEVDEIDEEMESEEGIRIKRYAFNSYRMDRSIRDLLGWKEAKKIETPDFQRNFVWSYSQASKFIDSILLGLPIPDLFVFRDVVCESSKEIYLLIDGLQRLTTIEYFKRGFFPKPNGEKRDFKIGLKSSDWYNKKYSDLSDSDKAFFEDYSMKLTVFDSSSADSSQKYLYMTEVFSRINSGATHLTKQEIRNAIYRGQFTDELKLAPKNPVFEKLMSEEKGAYSQGCKDQEFILRTLAYYHVTKSMLDGDSDRVSPYQDEIMGDYMDQANKKAFDFENDFDLFFKAVERINSVGTCLVKAFQRGSNELSEKIHPVTTESVIIALMLGLTLPRDSDELLKFKKSLKETETGRNPFYSSTRDPKNVIKRYNMLCEVMK